MGASDESWAEWDASVADGIETWPWEEQLPANVQAWLRASKGAPTRRKFKKPVKAKLRAQK